MEKLNYFIKVSKYNCIVRDNLILTNVVTYGSMNYSQVIFITQLNDTLNNSLTINILYFNVIS